jgi:serine protease Do
MPTLLFVPLNGEDVGKNYRFDQETILIGTAPVCNLLINHPASPTEDSDVTLDTAIVFTILQWRNSKIYLSQNHPGIEILINKNLLNLQPHKSLALEDGDLLAFRFQNKEYRYSLHLLESPSLIANSNALATSGSTDVSMVPRGHLFPEVDVVGHIHPLTATHFLKGLALGLWTEIPKRFRLFSLLGAIAVFVGFIAVGIYVLYNVQEQTTAIKNINLQRRQYENKIEDLKKQNEELRQVLNKERARVNSAQKITETFQNGVCLIQGSYTYVNSSGKRLRYLDASFNDRSLVDGRGDLNVSFDGTGDVFYEEFSGTGFSIAEGVIVSNRHVLQPWWRGGVERMLAGERIRPEMLNVAAYFPGIKRKFPLTLAGFSREHDIAFCTFDQGDAAIPSLPLDPADEAAIVGQPIVAIGYPTGLEGLIERLEDKTKAAIERKAITTEDRIKEVTERGLLRPLITQGHINGLNAGRIIHDAATTDGGSGSPIFNSEGYVIGINASILANANGVPVQGTNLGVPIRFVVDLRDELQLTKEKDKN